MDPAMFVLALPEIAELSRALLADRGHAVMQRARDQKLPGLGEAHHTLGHIDAIAQHIDPVVQIAHHPDRTQVHAEAQRHARNGLHTLLIGHEGHPEVIGTMGQIEPGSMTLIETVADADAFVPEDASKLAYVTQTTLSVEDTRDIVEALRRRFP
ncbi:MAG: hypothetical protein QE494_09035, partial [Ramlibacter sp.]|nr:hypothetical protein [Ramlibacter sp.]